MVLSIEYFYQVDLSTTNRAFDVIIHRQQKWSCFFEQVPTCLLSARPPGLSRLRLRRYIPMDLFKYLASKAGMPTATVVETKMTI